MQPCSTCSAKWCFECHLTISKSFVEGALNEISSWLLDSPNLPTNSSHHPKCPVCRSSVVAHVHISNHDLKGSLDGIARLYEELSDTMLSDTRRYMHVQNDAIGSLDRIVELMRRHTTDVFDECQIEHERSLLSQHLTMLNTMQPEPSTFASIVEITSSVDLTQNACFSHEVFEKWDQAISPIHFHTFLSARRRFLNRFISVQDLAVYIISHMQARECIKRFVERMQHARRVRNGLNRLCCRNVAHIEKLTQQLG